MIDEGKRDEGPGIADDGTLRHPAAPRSSSSLSRSATGTFMLPARNKNSTRGSAHSSAARPDERRPTSKSLSAEELGFTRELVARLAGCQQHAVGKVELETDHDQRLAPQSRGDDSSHAAPRGAHPHPRLGHACAEAVSNLDLGLRSCQRHSPVQRSSCSRTLSASLRGAEYFGRIVRQVAG